MGGWFKELPGLDGLKGLCSSGARRDVMSALGASVQVIAGGEIYPALERGAIDATEWVGPYDDEKLGFYKVAKNYYYPGWWEPGPSMSIYIGEKAWASLPVTYQEILKSAIHEAGLEMQRRYDARNPEALQDSLKRRHPTATRTDDGALGVIKFWRSLQQRCGLQEGPRSLKLHDAQFGFLNSELTPSLPTETSTHPEATFFAGPPQRLLRRFGRVGWFVTARACAVCACALWAPFFIGC